jgi:peptidoglycan/LPS O-acetylase OafA/YrhL
VGVISRTISFQDTTASALLDMVRGLAAILVCLEHLRNLLFVDYPQVSTHRALLAIPYLISGAGHQSVIVFFVLSGYLISGSVFRQWERRQWSWRLYLTHRLLRLWIVLLPALILGGLIDVIGLHFHLNNPLYFGEIANHMSGNVASTLNARTFFGNLFFLQGIVVPTFGSNSPLWSLANEFWYYILFPCGWVALRSGMPTMHRVFSGCLFLVAAFLAGKNIMPLFPVWLLGSILAALPRATIRIPSRILAACTYVLLFFFLAKAHFISGIVSDYILGAATFLFLWAMLSAHSPVPNALWVTFSRTTARFSYTLYLVHVPFLFFFTAITEGDARWTPNIRHIAAGTGCLCLTIVYAFLIASLTEFRTDHVRKWVELRMGLSLSSSSKA